jgi:RNA polymerase sigma-70 factor (ECF subfamily)
MVDVSIPLAENHPVAVALEDPAIQARLWNAARAFLGRCSSELSPTQRTAEAEAIAQEAASRAWKRRDQFDASKDVVKWLVGFVINVAREFAKKRSRDATGPPEDGPDLEALALNRSRPIDDAVADKLLIEQLVAQLPQLDRQMVLMKYCEEMTCAEIGQRIGMNENAVRVRVYRAILKLKNQCGLTGEGHP